jgi:hypothetical protein
MEGNGEGENGREGEAKNIGTEKRSVQKSDTIFALVQFLSDL